jgi:predicted ATPase/DNA-binding XRE family transcriptional regulator
MNDGVPVFGEALQRYRHIQRLTQAELAEKAGLSERTISDLERGLKHPQRATVRLLIEALSLPSAQADELESAARPQPLTPQPSASRPTRHNLPAPLTSFVGRDRDVTEVIERVAQARLLTLTGIGGCGKTRLAHEVARGALPTYSDGVWFVELGPVADPLLVPRRVADVLGVRETTDQAGTTILVAVVAAQHMLLVLDNCEHMLQACAVLADALLRGCPNLRILATSREPLGIGGEVAWRVPSLTVPELDRAITEQAAERSPAVQLFVDRATAALPRFMLTERNTAAVVQICRRLDGIPLALELAAAQIVALTPSQVLDRLDQSFRLLTGGSRVALPRQQTLEAALDWSYDLLGAREQQVFERLAVFAGGWTLEGAEAVCADADGIGVDDVLELLVDLVRKSLVMTPEADDGIQRYRLLEVVRDYARRKLMTRGATEVTAVRERHAAFYMAEVERLYPDMWRYGTVVWSNADVQARALPERMEQMQDNLRVALSWLLAERRVADGLRLAVTLSQFWISRGAFVEISPWLESMREMAEQLADETDQVEVSVAMRARVSSVLGTVASSRGQHAQATTFMEHCVALSREYDDASNLARSLGQLGRSLWIIGAEERAVAALEEALSLGRQVGDPLALGLVLMYLAELALWQQRYELSSMHMRECLNLVGWPSNRGQLATWGVALLGRSAFLRGEMRAATTYLHQACEVLRASPYFGPSAQLPRSLEWLAAVEAAEGQLIRAARLFGAAEAWWLACGAVRYAPEQPAYERDVANLRAQLDEAVLAAAWTEGRAMTLDQVVRNGVDEVASPSGLGPA